MKQKIIITNKNQEIIFQGNPYNLPIQYETIKQKSIELFNDDEPCVIHQSYATQKLIDDFMKQFSGIIIHEVPFIKLNVDYQFIKLDQIQDLYLTIKR
jgi:hypothetical protein